MPNTPAPLRRRSFLRGAAGVGAGLAFASPFSALAARTAASIPDDNGKPRGAPTGLGYGPLSPVKDRATGLELLKLPRGFEYTSFGWTGERMTDGQVTPGSHDGMAAFRDGDVVRLVRNHERTEGAPFAPATSTYDPAFGGGTTNLTFCPERGALVESYGSLSGTIRNCAGGPHPSGSWLSCEETTTVSNLAAGQETPSSVRHGYVFEVPATGLGSGDPIKQMGRFSHEATATDPATGIVYETEDAGSSVLYRYVPTSCDDLAAGGVLQAMALEDGNGAPIPTTVPWTTGRQARADWVLVDNPDPAAGAPSTSSQAQTKGGSIISRGEGAWYGNGVVYAISTNGGPAGQGQVFSYDPVTSLFTCVFSSPSADVLNAPDNVCVSPRGGLVLCEDGSGKAYLHGLSPDGEIFKFAENNVVLSGTNGFSGDYTGSEWAGACFEPKNGNWMFANIQSPGISFAITGPWRKGVL